MRQILNLTELTLLYLPCYLLSAYLVAFLHFKHKCLVSVVFAFLFGLNVALQIAQVFMLSPFGSYASLIASSISRKPLSALISCNR